ncbi:hypothetical protein [Bacillus haynesii]|uniref:hypothetical protein n=1 Tax=Bacillus haynesii TaxID=1925021 RepID=UPI00227F280F|nr:hypothetical protein [Bacillus haynesii]MCY9156267.1 hypothetical protein [Bacillus haynesii]MCY9450352.1 hypothetical protein [Bacillus haynesii]MEC0685068.1 hypothetical protein [Bacillus haynesii]
MSIKWYDNDTDTFFEEGHRVTWFGDENETEGELKMIGEKTFAVQWEDGSYIEYPNDHQEAIKKI